MFVYRSIDENNKKNRILVECSLTIITCALASDIPLFSLWLEFWLLLK